MNEKELVKAEVIVNSMTVKERQNPIILNAKRRIRIAKGKRHHGAGREPPHEAVLADARDDEEV